MSGLTPPTAGVPGGAPPPPPLAPLFRFSQRASHLIGRPGLLSIERCLLVEADRPSPPSRGLSDLHIRLAGPADVPAVAALDDRRYGLLQERLRRGDLIYVGELEREIVCATCFHPGPSPFGEEETTFARWRLDDPATFWSYDAMARPAVRSLGVVAKLFSVALAEVFGPRGAKRVRGFIHHWNQPSILLHLRMGFRVLGTLTAVGVPGLKWLRWEEGGTTRQWVLPRRSDLALPP